MLWRTGAATADDAEEHLERDAGARDDAAVA
jgi:hypothetical protein